MSAKNPPTTAIVERVKTEMSALQGTSISAIYSTPNGERNQAPLDYLLNLGFPLNVVQKHLGNDLTATELAAAVKELLARGMSIDQIIAA